MSCARKLTRSWRTAQTSGNSANWRNACFKWPLELHGSRKVQPQSERSDSITRRVHWACEPLVEYLLFRDEAPLKEAVAGTSKFAKEFTARGPFDAKGRTLREFDLRS